MAAEKDPSTFGLQKEDETSTDTNYGAVGSDGEATPEATAAPKPELTEEEREELKAQVLSSTSTLCSKCCSEGFFLILMFLFVGKLQGASFSSLWIISPFLLGVSSVARLSVSFPSYPLPFCANLWLFHRLELSFVAWVSQSLV